MPTPCAAARVHARTCKTFRRFTPALATCGQSREQRAQPSAFAVHAPRAGRAIWLVPGCGVLGAWRMGGNGSLWKRLDVLHEAAGIGFDAKGLGYLVAEDREGCRHGWPRPRPGARREAEQVTRQVTGRGKGAGEPRIRPGALNRGRGKATCV
jgi:hypothetical protein